MLLECEKFFDRHNAGPPNIAIRLQLYSLPTRNGVKVSIMLEEIGLPYDVHCRLQQEESRRKIVRETAELVRQHETGMSFNHSVRMAEPTEFISVKCGRAAHVAPTK